MHFAVRHVGHKRSRGSVGNGAGGDDARGLASFGGRFEHRFVRHGVGRYANGVVVGLLTDAKSRCPRTRVGNEVVEAVGFNEADVFKALQGQHVVVGNHAAVNLARAYAIANEANDVFRRFGCLYRDGRGGFVGINSNLLRAVATQQQNGQQGKSGVHLLHAVKIGFQA